MIFLNNCNAQLKTLQMQYEEEKKRLSELPVGKVTRKIAKGSAYYYIRKNGKLVSLNKNKEFAKKLIEREKIEHNISMLQSNIATLKKTINRYNPIIRISDTVWDTLKENQNNYKPENLIHMFDGVHYRSKSEVGIVMTLHSYGIKVKYEVELVTGGSKLYPDFAIRRERDGKTFYWEHFGLTDDEAYLDKTYKKLEDYHKMGINLWDNLIISFDKPDGGIDMDYIVKIIELYLL